MKITVTDATGAVVRELKGPKEKGLNRASWDLRVEPPVPPPARRRRILLRAAARAARALPAPTPSKVTRRAPRSATRPVVVEEDPRITIGDAERKEWYQAPRQARPGCGGAPTPPTGRSTALKKQLARRCRNRRRPAARRRQGRPQGAGRQAWTALARQLNRQDAAGVRGRAPGRGPRSAAAARARPLPRDQRITAPPTAQQRQALVRVQKQVDETVAAVNAVIEKGVPEMNRMLGERGVGRIDGGKPIP